MLIAEIALTDLRAKLVAEGFDEARSQLAALWSAVKAWATLPVDDVAEDGLHFECSLGLAGPARGRGEPAFTVAFHRFFSFEDDEGDYIGMQRTGVDLRYAVEDESRAIKPGWRTGILSSERPTRSWGSGGARAGDWVAQVEVSQSCVWRWHTKRSARRLVRHSRVTLLCQTGLPASLDQLWLRT